MRLTEATVQETLNRIDAIALAEEHTRLEKKGGRYWGCCPFHNEKTPSFTVDPDKKLYYCFGCHKGGAMLDFYMELERLTFPEAIEALAKRYGVPVEYEGRTEGEDLRQSKREDLYELYDRVSGSFHYILMETSEGRAAKDYILGRGFTEESLRNFELGFTPKNRSWLYAFLSKKGYSPELLASSGLFSNNYPQSAFFSGRLMFPIRDRRSRAIAFGGRILEGEGPKYLNSGESEIYKKGRELFALDLALPEIRKTGEVYIAEGYMDVMALHQAGIKNAAAPLGTAFTDEQAKTLRHFAERITLMFDSDEAGQKAAYAGILTSRRNGFECAVVVPQGNLGLKEGDPTYPMGSFKDPADILRENGPEALNLFAKSSINDFEYLMSRGKTQFDLSMPEGKKKALAFIFPYIAALDSEIMRDSCIGELADIFGVERRAAQHDFEMFHHEEPKRRITQPTPLQEKPIISSDELRLLTAVLVNNAHYPRLRAILSIEELEDIRAKELYIALEEWYRNGALGMGEAALPYDLISRVTSEALRNYIVEQGASEAFSLNPEFYLEGSVKRVKQKGLERRQAEIVLELRAQKHRESPRALEDLLMEKMHIDAELRRLKEANE